ncbi:hypothetical protein EON67_07520 [archaeon]|nr:MAG: hypothetical protein EON67_07520 [archaeon]
MHAARDACGGTAEDAVRAASECRTALRGADSAPFQALTAPPTTPSTSAEVWIARLVDERAGLEVDVAPFHGAELCDIRCRRRPTCADDAGAGSTRCPSSAPPATSLLYRGQARASDVCTPPTGWQGRAQVRGSAPACPASRVHTHMPPLG